MTEIKALKELRELTNVQMDRWLKIETLKAADAIEAEIVERFVELPVDADGMMLEIGDKLEYRDETMTLCGLVWDGADWYATNVFESTSWKPVGRCRHVKPRTLEDALDDLQAETVQIFGTYATGAIDHEMMRTEYADSIRACAAEIRELMGVGE